MNINRLITLAMTFALVTGAHAATGARMPANLHPKAYCDVLAGVGYQARPFNAKTGGCSTVMVPLSKTQGRNGLENNLAFYSMGEMDNFAKLDRVSLILNVNAEMEAAAAHKELARVASALSIALTGEELAGVRKAVLAGKSAKLKASGWNIGVEYSKWRTGLGHDIAVRFTPAQ